MDLSQIKDLLPYICGYGYAVVAGHFLIRPIVTAMWRTVLSEVAFNQAMSHYWQPALTGIIERTLFVIALAMEAGELIGVWIVLKIAGDWGAWFKNSQDEHRKNHQRTVFMILVDGTGLSILFSVVGYKSIDWIKAGSWTTTIAVGAILIAFCLVTWRVVHRREK